MTEFLCLCRDRGNRRRGYHDNRGYRGDHRERDRKRSRSPYYNNRRSPPSPSYRKMAHYNSSPPRDYTHSTDHAHQSHDHVRLPAYDVTHSSHNEIPSLAPLDPHYDHTHPSSYDHTHSQYDHTHLSQHSPPLSKSMSGFTLEPLRKNSPTPPPPGTHSTLIIIHSFKSIEYVYMN